ncbi:hypothetical protein BKP35_08640 [Anaerobacillus arseniciselenatis]|uniref:Methyltransferase type 11 domain-containing protein n=1 Tax=Anaerobacillus arseniciselenatis TaxID=85682 RepID=A0A1S2LNZ0_9BACI|nr:class I SAM-dependent methyltransferase [Anaerobacillus arseniciselenatis]OIJ13833.1 hypothetical protein BKP35_08640 [Anaerobacillus arseniciselenatis]
MALFDMKASTYDDWCVTPLGGFVDFIEKNLMKEVAELKQNEKVLDLGCGTGAYSYWLLGEGLHVTGIDISDRMLEMARTKPESNKIHFIQGDVHTLPFSNETFDLIISNITLEFTENPNKVFNEVMRVLKDGGRFVCGFIGKESDWGQLYEDKGKNDESSVFSNAQLFNIDDVRKLSSVPPVELKYALYVGMKEFINIDQAKSLEEERKITYSNNKAGYMVAKWIK